MKNRIEYQKKGFLAQDELMVKIIQSSHSNAQPEKSLKPSNLDFRQLLMEKMIISEKGVISLIWSIVDIFSCISSSYIYAYLGAFGKDSDDTLMNTLITTYEGIFLITILKNFSTDYTPLGSTEVVKNLRLISLRYLKEGGFILDFICIFPFVELFKNYFEHKVQLFYLIKTLRIFKGIKIFNVSKMMAGIKDFKMRQLQDKIKENPELA